MSKINYEEILKSLLENDFVRQEINKYNLTAEQIKDALPILIDMSNQNIENSKYVISFYVTDNGSVKRQEVLSPKGLRESFMSRILSQEFSPINFETEKDYYKTEGRAQVVKEFIPYLSDDVPQKGLYIHGSMGIGKTFTAKRFAKKLAELGKEVAFVNLASLASKLKASFSEASGKQAYIMEILKEVQFLFFDDIGAEQITEWFRDEVIFSILNYRMEHNKTTFFTSNYNIKELEKIESKTSKSKYWDIDKSKRLIERIKTIANPVLITGKNLRYK